MVLGRYPDISLAQARELATAAIGDLVSGIHPKAARAATAARPLPPWLKPSSAGPPPPSCAPPRDRENHRPASHAALGQPRRLEIPRADAITMIETLAAKSGPYMAAKALALASSIFRYAMTREQVESNPCNLIKPRTSSGKWLRASGS